MHTCEELHLSCSHEIRALWMTLDVIDELVKEGIEHGMLGYTLMVFENRGKAAQDHLCGDLVDLSITLLISVVLDKTHDD